MQVRELILVSSSCSLMLMLMLLAALLARKQHRSLIF